MGGVIGERVGVKMRRRGGQWICLASVGVGEKCTDVHLSKGARRKGTIHSSADIIISNHNATTEVVEGLGVTFRGH